MAVRACCISLCVCVCVVVAFARLKGCANSRTCAAYHPSPSICPSLLIYYINVSTYVFVHLSLHLSVCSFSLSLSLALVLSVLELPACACAQTVLDDPDLAQVGACNPLVPRAAAPWPESALSLLLGLCKGRPAKTCQWYSWNGRETQQTNVFGDSTSVQD